MFFVFVTTVCILYSSFLEFGYNNGILQERLPNLEVIMSSCLGVKHLDTDFTDQGKAREQIDLACEVLKTFFKVQDPAAILSQYGISMLRALNHPNVEVKELVLQELNRAASEPMLTPRLCEERDLLLCVVTCVGHEDNSVARPSVQFLVKLGSTLEGTKSLFSTSMLETLNRVAQLNDINRFRVYEIIVEISTVFQPGLEASRTSGLLDAVLEELKSDDILTVLNTLELFQIIVEISTVFQSGLEASRTSGLLDAVLEELKSDDILTVLNTLELFQIIVEISTVCQPGLEASRTSGLLDAVLEELKSDDILTVLNTLELFQIIVEISTVCQPGLEASRTSGLLDAVLEELKSDDILAVLNTLELITKLALTHHGFQYLESHGVVRHLAEKLCGKEGEAFLSYFLLGLVKFFGNVAQLRPQETFHDYPEAMTAIFRTIQEDADQNLVLVALETFGYIATTTHGKWVLHKKGIYMKEIMNRIMEIVLKWPTDSRVRGLNVLANLLRLKVSDQDTEMLAVVREWFNLLGSTDHVMTKVGDMAQQPFPEIKLAVLMLLQVLAEQPWSQQYIRNTPGLLEFLLDRNSDSTMLEKTARFAVIESLAESPTSEAVFGEEMVKQFKRFTKEGAVYVQLQTEVAIEKAD
ncbi:26S proteasome non-ATPase regulatory subunit 5-like isoform X3 [Homalodisca vitripennis]|uniref:26S proteasome non-ATPase regulatory subunit 5-like isoform X3 n=1 Tax=Homalodisca vitripennis TaxID=197043 RepID=UPI001EEAEC36|nr:26S proteasome non-ATPase regulatory subunit 5-like isoform X3 [Homalodisca vitripennis]